MHRLRLSLYGSLLLAVTGCLRGDGGLDDDTSGTTEPAPASSTSTGADDTSTGSSGIQSSTSGESSSSGESTSSSTGPAASCGDGTQDPGEQCDDGANNSDQGACKLDCTPQACGDGFLGPGELCDDGDLDDTNLCTSTCTPAACGDGFVQPGEDCDDGDPDGLDACTAGCVQNICGDGILYTGVEACDDAGQSATCDGDCTAPECGDGDPNPAAGEACDDGNASEVDACTTACEFPACGDGHVQPGEACDDGGLLNGDGCDAGCKKEQVKCQNQATLVSAAPGNRAVVCQRLDICEKDYAILCPLGWHLCSADEFNARNTAWNYAPTKPALGAIRCREGGGAGQYGFKSTLSIDHADNCLYSSSRPQCVSNLGCDDKDNLALCCAPLASCGNGVVDHLEEQCDDGNKSDNDECLANCMTRYAAGKAGCG
jgi:cysteine-rich repeat protein